MPALWDKRRLTTSCCANHFRRYIADLPFVQLQPEDFSSLLQVSFSTHQPSSSLHLLLHSTASAFGLLGVQLQSSRTSSTFSLHSMTISSLHCVAALRQELWLHTNKYGNMTCVDSRSGTCGKLATLLQSSRPDPGIQLCGIQLCGIDPVDQRSWHKAPCKVPASLPSIRVHGGPARQQYRETLLGLLCPARGDAVHAIAWVHYRTG